MVNKKSPSKALMWVYFISFLYIGMLSGLTGPSLPYLAKQVNVGLDTFSFLFVAGSIGGIIGALVGARGFDHLPGHKIMAVVLFFSALLTFLTPFIGHFAFMLILIFFLGIANITFDTGGNTLLIWWWGDNVGPYMNTLHFMFGAGAIASPLLVGQVLAASGGIGFAYWIVAALGIPLSIVLFFFPSPAIPTKEDKDQSKTARPQNTLVWLFILFFVLYVGAEVGFSNWVYTFAIETDLANPINAAYLTSLFWIGLTAGRLISIPLTARIQIETLMWISILGSIIAGGVMLLMPQAIWVSVALLGLSFANIFPLTLSWAAKVMPISGKINGWFFAGANIGAMIFPWMIGQLFVAINPNVLIWTVFLISLSLIGVMLVLQRKVSA